MITIIKKKKLTKNILHFCWEKTFLVNFDNNVAFHCLFVDWNVLINCSLLSKTLRKHNTFPHHKYVFVLSKIACNHIIQHRSSSNLT